MTTAVRTGLAIALAAALAGSAPAATPAPAQKPTVQNSEFIAKRLAEFIDKIPRLMPYLGAAKTGLGILRWADDNAWVSTDPELVRTGAPAVEAVQVVVTFRVPDVEYRQEWFNALPLFGTVIPGTRVQHSIRIDCLVHGWIRDGRPRLSWDPRKPGQLAVRLPRFDRFTTEFPEGSEGHFETTFGDLKPEFLYGESAVRQRAGLYEAARVAARDRLVADLAQDSEFLVAALRRDLQSRYPDDHLEGATDEGDTVLNLTDFFTRADSGEAAGPDRPSGLSHRDAWMLLPAALILALAVQRLARHLRRKKQ